MVFTVWLWGWKELSYSWLQRNKYPLKNQNTNVEDEFYFS